jgi:hypothetical protein
MAARRRWIPILFGVGVFIVFIGIAAVVAITAWFQQALQVQESTHTSAQAEFESIRQQFGERPPLLELRDGRPVHTPARPETATGAAGAPVESLHLMAFDPDNGRLARFSVPFWLVRLSPGPVRFGSHTSDLDDRVVNLRAEDIEEYGPGIILDTTTPSGERVLLWAQ